MKKMDETVYWRENLDKAKIDVYNSYGNLQFGRNDHVKQGTAKSERF